VRHAIEGVFANLGGPAHAQHGGGADDDGGGGGGGYFGGGGLFGVGGGGGGKGGGGRGGIYAGPSDGGASQTGLNGSIVLSTFSWNQHLLARVIDEARLLAVRRRGRNCDVRKISLVESRFGGELPESFVAVGGVDSDTGESATIGWQRLEAPPRRMDTVFMAGQAEEMLSDVGRFLSQRAWCVGKLAEWSGEVDA
jgi:hypothetical protein